MELALMVEGNLRVGDNRKFENRPLGNCGFYSQYNSTSSFKGSESRLHNSNNCLVWLPYIKKIFHITRWKLMLTKHTLNLHIPTQECNLLLKFTWPNYSSLFSNLCRIPKRLHFFKDICGHESYRISWLVV